MCKNGRCSPSPLSSLQESLSVGWQRNLMLNCHPGLSAFLYFLFRLKKVFCGIDTFIKQWRQIVNTGGRGGM
ncbi:hypothetical protein [Candidatus Ichthyocystis sparus]|uniref:hypothetical protein n=1 Tax=Candidatus Ichthyocystis sparus TaxID=1561004 RepID=UPI00114736B7|nr:hypothetical protein [Candidatus Ichthyocystis sparus]